MAVTTRKIDKNSRVGRAVVPWGLTSAVSQTRVPFGLITPGYDFQVTDLEFFNSLYAAVLSVDVLIVAATELITKGTLIISGADAIKFKTTTGLIATAGGLVVRKAPTDNLVFTAAHTITAAKFGCIRIQMDAALAVTTKVVSATQAYNTAAAALAALPDADAGKVPLGYIAIENNAGDWVANTDDLTNGSDLTTAAFVDQTESAKTVIAAGLTALVTGNAKPALHGTISNLRGAATDMLVAIYTSDGAGAVTNGRVTVTYRALNMNGDGGLAS